MVTTAKAAVSIFISDKIDLKLKMAKRGKGNHYIMIKRSVYQEDITTVNIHPSNMENLDI